jgi:hypothetical protein
MKNDISQIQCQECKDIKPRADFKGWAVKKGDQLYCKDCRRMFQWRTKNNNTIEYRKEYYSRPEIRERQKVHHKKYIERIKLDPEKLKNHRKKINSRSRHFRKIHPLRRISKYLCNQDKNSTITAFDLWKIAKHQKCLCALTGRPLTTDNVSPDHIVCRTHNGSSNIDNIRLVVKEVNVARNVLSDDAFINLCNDVIKWKSLNK